ncbi:MAG: potassium transporter Kup [Myxococcaceae bacterium]|nr:potassium transporter Kup [Myxococcaceae bacterium]
MSSGPVSLATSAVSKTGAHRLPSSLAVLAMGALGIVYGDIGTSPLYAVKECFAGTSAEVAATLKAEAPRAVAEGAAAVAPVLVTHHKLIATQVNVLGVLSLIFWSLLMVVAVKYLLFIMRADNKGEGGIFALLALVPQATEKISPGVRNAVVLAALFGAALLYGDGVITPAISVLSAVEGLDVATEAAHPYVVPITVGILIGLFMVQRRGTGHIGKIFGPIMLVWFATLTVLGLRYILRAPAVLQAVNPVHAVVFFSEHGPRAIAVLGSVVLCITGGEALYADMGHFGPRPIRLTWYSLVFPALLINYFGQGALLLQQGPEHPVKNPFYGIVPEPLLYPMVVLATAATVIASQALISGAFSLTRQAVQLGYFPRVTIIHTSEKNEGQIYIPEVNQALAVACVVLVLAFKESSALAAAYGIAVTGTMGITSVVYFFVVRRTWGWSAWKAVPLVALFLVFDVGFFSANLLKFFEGGWLPIAVGLSIFVLMTTWKTGRSLLGKRFAQTVMPIQQLLEDFQANPPHRVRGTAVFMSGSPEGTPPVMLHHLKHNQVLHRQVVLLSILPADMPVVPKEEQVEVKELGQGFFRLIVRSGFMETPNVPSILKRARHLGLVCEPSTTSYFLGRETLLTSGKSPMSRWRKALFAFVSRNALPATSYFGLPPGRVVELGMQVDL